MGILTRSQKKNIEFNLDMIISLTLIIIDLMKQICYIYFHSIILRYEI